MKRDGDIAGMGARAHLHAGDDGEAAQAGEAVHLSWLELAVAWLRVWLGAWEDSRYLDKGRFCGVIAWEGGESGDLVGGLAPTSIWEMYRELAPHLSVAERRWLARECVACLGVLSWRRRLFAGMRAGHMAAWTPRNIENSSRRVARKYLHGHRRGAAVSVGLPQGVRARASRVADPPGVGTRERGHARPREAQDERGPGTSPGTG